MVTGAGSGVGNGIVKALRHSALPMTICCSDIDSMNVGLFRADEAVIWPKVEAPEALETITRSLKDLRIDVLLIGSEYDLAFFAEHCSTIERETGTRIVVSPSSTIAMANDKWQTFRFLDENNLPRPDTVLPESIDDAIKQTSGWDYPLMLKPRAGTSSRHVHIVRDEKMLRQLYPGIQGPIIQQLLDTPSASLKNEFTATIFKTGTDKIIGPFIARRTLRGGDSWNLEIAPFDNIHPLLLSIAAKLPVMGSLNVQLIQTETGPVPFEINARFSGTTAIRAHFGFNDAAMAVRHFLQGEEIEAPVIGNGMVFRYMEEVFVDGINLANAAEGFTQGEVHSWF